MINSADMNDLQLEDVEDYAADYPTGYPEAEPNIAAVGSQEIMGNKKRTNRLVYSMKKNKWVTGLLFVILVIAVAVFVIIGGSSGEETVVAASGAHQAPIYIDPKSLDPEITASLMEKIVSVYDRKGLNSDALGEGSGVTPQKKAFYWLASNENVDDIDHTELMQRYTLAVFYYATNAVVTPYTERPKPWISAHLWLSESHVCEWKGVNCNEQDHVSSISLERNNLTGSLPVELAIIGSTLHVLDLTSNLIYMEQDMYDVFKKLTDLESLLMDDNYLMYDKGLPSQFRSLQHLKKLRLSYNLFEGQLEQEHKVLSHLGKLTHLEIESNFLTGTLPSVIGELTNLAYIYMRRNDLSFNLDFLKGGKLTDLFALWLDSNKITGTIPTEIGLLTDLASVSMTNATLTGSIPSEIGNLVGLRRLWLYSNQLSGSIPVSMNSLTDLEVFEVHNNKIVGAMPQGICANVASSSYEFKTLTSDCVSEVQCDGSCCTDCY